MATNGGYGLALFCEQDLTNFTLHDDQYYRSYSGDYFYMCLASNEGNEWAMQKCMFTK